MNTQCNQFWGLLQGFRSCCKRLDLTQTRNTKFGFKWSNFRDKGYFGPRTGSISEGLFWNCTLNYGQSFGYNIMRSCELWKLATFTTQRVIVCLLKTIVDHYCHCLTIMPYLYIFSCKICIFCMKKVGQGLVHSTETALMKAENYKWYYVLGILKSGWH